MYQSFVYLEVRILLSNVAGVFITREKAVIDVVPTVLNSVSALVHALGSVVPEKSVIEQQVGPLPQPPSEKKFTGYSVRIAEGGHLDIMFHAHPKTVHIEEVRLEEDCGRLTHSAGITRMDYKWVGCPSIRLRTTPSFELGEEAELFLDEIRRLVSYLHVVNGNASDGGIRCNAYVALSKFPELPDYSVKLRNLNSFNFVRKAINFELSRQEGILESGGSIDNESRLWDERQNATEFYQKRSAVISRFEPLCPLSELDLLNVHFPDEVDGKSTVELPEQRRLRLRRQYGLSRLRSEFICDDKDRADFFESVVAAGAKPLDAAHLMASEMMRLLNIRHERLADCLLTPDHFASILMLLESGKIHSGIVKHLLQLSMDTGKSPEILLKEQNIEQLADESKLLPVIRKVLSENKTMAKRLCAGEMAPLEFLTGQVMKKTGGMAVPQSVKSLIKNELKISIVYVISFGGVISAVRQADGTVCGGDPHVLKDMLSVSVPEIPVQIVTVGQFLSEELEPKDWGVLVAEIASRMNTGTANGIVVTHGTDTLPYTAALLYWLFSASSVPVVLTASSSLPSEGSEASDNLALACRIACSKKQGVYVALGGNILSPVNLKFNRPSVNGFTNWNMSFVQHNSELFISNGPLAIQFAGITEPDAEVMARMFEEAAGRILLCRIYPGFRADRFNDNLEKIVSAVFLELYDTGTGSMRSGDFSLKPLLTLGRKKGCHFYCTSQQEGSVNFSQYVTSMRLWREGAVPMGILTTESSIALYYAASLLADSAAERDAIMEEYAGSYSDTLAGEGVS